jgi:hypothetical protein
LTKLGIWNGGKVDEVEVKVLVQIRKLGKSRVRRVEVHLTKETKVKKS